MLSRQTAGSNLIGGRGKRRRPVIPTTVKKKPKAPPKPVGHATAVAPGVVEHMREAHKREVKAVQQSYAANLKRIETASKAREDQWRAREDKWETERKALQHRLLKSPKPQAGSGTVAGVSEKGDSATRYLQEAAYTLHGSLTSAVTALQCTSWLINTLGKEKGQHPPPRVAVTQYTKLLEKYTVKRIVTGGCSSSQGEA